MNPTSREPVCRTDPGCITCSDQGMVMRVAEIRGEDGFAACTDAAGALSEVQIDLVEPVNVGDSLLVHAGVALVHLGQAEAGS